MTTEEIISQINSMRKDPSAFANYIKTLYIDPVDNKGTHCRWHERLYEGRRVGVELYNFLKAIKPLPEIKAHPCLLSLSYNNAHYMQMNNYLTHIQESGNVKAKGLPERLLDKGEFEAALEAIGTVGLDHLNAIVLVSHI